MRRQVGKGDRKAFLGGALKAADWFVNSQLGGDGPAWDADRGRFLYYYFMPEGRHVPGINWVQGRALSVLSEAYKLTNEARYLEAAELGARYIAALQVTDPHYEKARGAIRERVPQDGFSGVLDGAQAATGLLMLERVTSNAAHLRRGRAFCDFVMRHFSTTGGLPVSADLYPAEKVVHEAGPEHDCIGKCTAIPVWHLRGRTGEEKYLAPVLWCADRILECQRGDGAMLWLRDVASAEEVPEPNQHWGRGEGEDRFILRNDDGIVVVVLAAFQATGEAKYLDAAVAYADWIAGNEPHERPFCGFPIQASNVLDIGEASGRDYSGWVLDNLDAHLLQLQVVGSGNKLAEGGFRGEDEENEGGIFGGRSLDYVSTRTTCYAAGTLFRLSGQGTGAGFSVAGLG